MLYYCSNYSILQLYENKYIKKNTALFNPHQRDAFHSQHLCLYGIPRVCPQTIFLVQWFFSGPKFETAFFFFIFFFASIHKYSYTKYISKIVSLPTLIRYSHKLYIFMYMYNAAAYKHQVDQNVEKYPPRHNHMQHTSLHTTIENVYTRP